MLRKNQVEVTFWVDFDLCKAWHTMLRKNQVEVAFQVDFDPCRARQGVRMTWDAKGEMTGRILCPRLKELLLSGCPR